MRNNVYNFIHNNNLRNIDVFLKKIVLFTAYPKVFNKLSIKNENFPHSVNNFWKSQNNLHYFNNSAFVICKTVMYAYYSSVIAKYFYETLDFA